MHAVDERNVETYEHKYGTAGYGLMYPDGHVIRLLKQVLQYELKMTGGAALDYGCGNGSHLEYLLTAGGFEPYGCDISPSAIEQCKARLPEFADHFKVVEPVSVLSTWCPGDLDLVFSNQVLYYLTDTQILGMLEQMHGLLKPGGIIYASMMDVSNYYYRRVAEWNREMGHVVLKGRLNEDSWINFKTRGETDEMFAAAGFIPVQRGYYDWQIREDDGPTKHWTYVGRKP